MIHLAIIGIMPSTTNIIHALSKLLPRTDVTIYHLDNTSELDEKVINFSVKVQVFNEDDFVKGYHFNWLFGGHYDLYLNSNYPLSPQNCEILAKQIKYIVEFGGNRN
jgi:hypothetical protein